MMKNKMMRAASILLVAVLLSTCAISGTFAKYVTTASGTDTARVAKWGIQMGSTDVDMFEDTYGTTVATSGVAGDAVVAPGTSSSALYKITGAPETDYKITFDYEVDKEVFLGAGEYTYTSTGMTYDPSMSQTVANKYYPIKYNYVITTNNGTVTATDVTYVETTVAGNKTYKVNTAYNTLGEALAALKKTTISFEANESCDVTIELTWDWAFDQTSTESKANAYDTILGDLAAGNTDLSATPVLGAGAAEYNLTVEYTLKMTATQTNE